MAKILSVSHISESSGFKLGVGRPFPLLVSDIFP